MKKSLMQIIVILINLSGGIFIKAHDISALSVSKADGIETEAVVSGNKALAAELSGTCYKGLSCSCPSCGRWSDIDGNGFCDRGK